MREYVLQQIGPAHGQFKQELIPRRWSSGSRRLMPGEGYLEVLTRPHVFTIYEESCENNPAWAR